MMRSSRRGQPTVTDFVRSRRDHQGGPSLDEGLRERKKRETRQHISDVATAMFLEHGFDAVRVAEVAAACSVSEKTVFNYFPTKEALLLDRADEMVASVRRALRPDASGTPVEAMVELIAGETAATADHWREWDLPDMRDYLRFADLVDSTPSLRAAQMETTERVAQVAAEAMAARAGVDPGDPEPQIAAHALIGLWQVFQRSLQRHVEAGHSPDDVERLVMADVRRAARLLDSGLWSFNLAVRGVRGREQQARAAAAAAMAQRQVMSALRTARTGRRRPDS